MNSQESKLSRQLQLYQQERDNLFKKHERIVKRVEEIDQILAALQEDLQRVQKGTISTDSLKSHQTLKKMSLGQPSKEEKPKKS